MPNWTCAAPGRAGFICAPTISYFSSDSNGTALESAQARLGPNPDIAGQGIFYAFFLAFLFSSALALLIHAWEISEIRNESSRPINNRRKLKREDHLWIQSIHHVFDRVLIAWSDQQLILGLATSIATIVEWCSFSTYHLNIIKQWLILCSATHINALLVHCDYFSTNHIPANILRILLIMVHSVLASIIVSDNGEAGEWSPTVGDHTPLQALPYACFFKNATRSDTLKGVVGWGGHGLRGDYLFWASVILLLVALFSLVGDLLHFWFTKAEPKSVKSRLLNLGSKKRHWWHWIWRSTLLVGNLGIGATVFASTKTLRSYMVDSKWLEDASEEQGLTYGQYIPLCLAGLVLFSACQGVADEIDNKNIP
ncbi:hypothetical protein QBC37DRAFT_371690 [Rhypophila decipiens]|uniref:Uncharacterized protein n=1 Tax=Rhypophila decipiens TaxID=261697 RepID=A0AAN7B9S6_9PEZI|nr:hypothetical protein QBC37DRAFT_371690 [Rhypophila decipiens]